MEVGDRYDIKLNVEIKVPADEKCLQAVDVASWCIFRKYEYGNKDFYNVLRSAIVEENSL